MPLPPRSIIQTAHFSPSALSAKTTFCPSCQILSLPPTKVSGPCPSHNAVILHVASYCQPFGHDICAGVGIDYGHIESGRNCAYVVPTEVVTGGTRNGRQTERSVEVWGVLKAVEKGRELAVNSLREMDRAKVPGRIRSFAGQIGSSWEEEGYKHSFSYSVPTNVKEIVILTSSLYFLDGIMLSPDSKPWSGTRPSYLSSSSTKNDGKQRKLRGRKYTFSGTLPAPQARIITSHKPSSSWFRKRTYPAAVDWDLFKAVERTIAECNKKGVLVSFVRVKKEGRKSPAWSGARMAAARGGRD